MKKIIYIISITFILLQSCTTGNSNGNISDNSLLLKKWYLVSYSYKGNTYNQIPCSNGNRDYLEFINPNIANYYHVKSTNDCSYALEANTWTKNGNIIQLKYYGNVSACTITELTATSLIYVETDSAGISYTSKFSSN